MKPTNCKICGIKLTHRSVRGRPSTLCDEHKIKLGRYRIPYESKKILFSCEVCQKQFLRGKNYKHKAGVACARCRHRLPFYARTVTCECGKEFKTTVKITKYCSQQCVQKYRSYGTKQCCQCGISFAARNSRHKFCSRECSNKLHCRAKHAKRNTIAIDQISMSDIVSRDGGLCQLCHKKVDMRLPRTHRMGATLDHIVAISNGGKHEYVNVQLAHRYCNSQKHNGTGFQMRLIG